jgi:ketosteroid isomerase-like protein
VSDTDDDFLESLRIRSVLERYCSLLDAGAVDDLLALFLDDCVLTMMGRTYQGKSEFAAALRGLTPVDRPTTLHALISPNIVVSGDHATAVSGWVLVDRGGEGHGERVALAGRYHDSLLRTSAATWRFTRRRAEALARPER